MPQSEIEMRGSFSSKLAAKIEKVREDLMRRRGTTVDDSEVLNHIVEKYVLPKSDEKKDAERAAACEQEETPDWLRRRVERDLAAGASSENAYLALSSLTYGYYRLSLRAAAQESQGPADPRVVARLERWNALLGAAYDASPEDERFRNAVHEAAQDLQHRAPPVRLRCVDESGDTVECTSTEAVIRGVNAAAGEVGIRGGPERLLERIMGGGAS